MNGIMKQTGMNTYASYEIGRYEAPTAKPVTPAVDPECKCSGFSMMAMAGALLMCVGIVLYALLTV